MSSSKIIIGVDGGGTKTAACLIQLNQQQQQQHNDDDTNALLISAAIKSRIVTGSTNWNSVGDATAKENLFVAFNLLLSGLAAENSSDKIHFVFVLGMACVDVPADKEKLSRWIDEYLSTRGRNGDDAQRSIYGDAVIALASGTNGVLHGVNLIAGTGVICYGRNAETKHEARAAGWGPLLGDRGSGYDIGLNCLRAVMEAYDGRNPEAASQSALPKMVLEHLKLSQPEALIAWAYTDADGGGGSNAAWDMMAALAPVCFAAHRDNKDAVATKILMDAADALAQNVAAVLKKLNFSSSSVVPIVLSGGIATQSEIMQWVAEKLSCLQSSAVSPVRFEIKTPHVNPEVAAALLAVQNNDLDTVKLI